MIGVRGEGMGREVHARSTVRAPALSAILNAPIAPPTSARIQRVPATSRHVATPSLLKRTFTASCVANNGDRRSEPPSDAASSTNNRVPDVAATYVLSPSLNTTG